MAFGIFALALFSLLSDCYAFAPAYLGDVPIENPDLLGGDILGIEDFDRSATVHPQHLWPEGVVPYVEDPGLKKTVSYLGDVSIENPDLLGGDILGIEDFDRSATVHPQHLWPEGVVPYVEDPGLKKTVFSSTLFFAMDSYKKKTCIRFVKRTTEKDYLRLFPGEGCYSHVGRTGGQQPLSLGQGCNWMGTVVHELGHAIGFYHEQNRSDRDEYLVIYWENIKDGLEDQFFKLKPEQNQLLTEFDYNSIMLYGSYTFSKDRKNLKTMEGKGGKFLSEVVSKHDLSKTDIKRINMLYKCK